MNLLLLTCFSAPLALNPQAESERQVVPLNTAAPKLVIYDVRDLLEQGVREIEPVQLGLELPAVQKAEVGQEAAVQPSAEELRDTAAKTLEAAVRKYITPKLEGPSVELQLGRNGSLFAVLQPDQHEWLQRFLNAQRRFEAMVVLQTRFIQLEAGELKKLGIDSSAVLPTSADRDALVAKLTAAPNTMNTMAPSVLAFPNQRCNVSVLNQVAYIKSFTVQVVEPGRQEIADPEVAVIHEGLSLSVRATPIDTGVLALDLTFDCAEVVRPIKTRKVRLSTSAPSEGEIGVPEVLSARIVSTVLVREGSSVVLSTPRQGEKKGDLVLVVTAERKPLPPAEPASK